jgi:hypothetical protein
MSGSNTSVRSPNGLYPIESGIELDDTSTAQRPSCATSPPALDMSYDSVTSPTVTSGMSPPPDTPTERAVKAGSRFVEDLESQQMNGQAVDLSRASTDSSASFFGNLTSPLRKPKLHVATDTRSIHSTYSNLGSAGTFDMTPSNSYFDLAPSSSSRDLINEAKERIRSPIHTSSRKYRRDSEDTVRARDEDEEVDDYGYRPPPRRKVGWFEFIFCMVSSSSWLI